MKTIYETYVKEICNKCKNRKRCKEELRIKINTTIKCEKYVGRGTNE